MPEKFADKIIYVPAKGRFIYAPLPILPSKTDSRGGILRRQLVTGSAAWIVLRRQLVTGSAAWIVLRRQLVTGSLVWIDFRRQLVKGLAAWIILR